ncbi:uncharacterized protein LOC110450756 isoform X3 [Mizuhopecten yessoensis]|uniref:uncharacterized protein LOC110450756 isoform X2 n=1 Tax=Mizuhopecten yessoensis TaxID=6573 RepID=UPI000B45721B|nr:uncharacterized protein LOC110450756 isoform X2 [Mizuhopecten yessoensis]XP_021354122.1 uncharacterized protein LOC110450756 isoform X3 [Mizuhopecten yessoensis]
MDRLRRHIAIEGPPWDIENISVLISRLIERNMMGTEEDIRFRRRALLIRECIINTTSSDCNILMCGSQSEGLYMLGSDYDFMYVINNVVALYLGQIVPPEDAHKTVLYVRESDCRPGYVTLQFNHIGPIRDIPLCNSLVPVGNVIFVSSDMYREQIVNQRTTQTGIRHVSNGPSCSVEDFDFVHCFHFNSWPREAYQWVTRPRLYGWPTQALIDKIVQSGSHLVPVGDKCSEDTLLQWRISFASAEILLVHSFSHIQMKTYCFLKYFLKQMKDTLRDIIGKEDDDILCSYHLHKYCSGTLKSEALARTKSVLLFLVLLQHSDLLC